MNYQAHIMLDISGLSGLTELTNLDISGDVASLEPLAGLTKLTSLRLYGNSDTAGYSSLAASFQPHRPDGPLPQHQ